MTGDQDAFGGATGFGATIGAVQGTRSAQQNLTVDGLVANDMGLPAGLSGQVNMDAVQEVKVLLSNYQAEYGRNPGANISMTTRGVQRNTTGQRITTAVTMHSTPTISSKPVDRARP